MLINVTLHYAVLELRLLENVLLDKIKIISYFSNQAA